MSRRPPVHRRAVHAVLAAAVALAPVLPRAGVAADALAGANAAAPAGEHAAAPAGQPGGLAGAPSGEAPPASPPSEEARSRFAPPAWVGPAEVPVADPLDASTDLVEVVGNWLGLSREPTPEERAAEARRRFHWQAVPFILTNPLIGFGFGVAAAGVFRLGEEGTKLSKFATNLLYTVNNQISVPLRTSLFFSEGDWSLIGYTNWQSFPAPTWGIGGDTPASAEVVVDKSLVRLWQTAYRRVFSDLYVGAGGYFDRYYTVSDRGTAPGVANPFTAYPFGTGGPYNNVGLSVDLLWESRDNPVNARSGYYLSGKYRISPTWLGSTYRWQSLYADGRAYVPLPGPNVLALWAYGWFAFGDVPYLDLPSVGSDPDARSGRGYIEGRHIGKSLLYAEAEYRFRIWDFIGGVVGMNVHSVGQPRVAYDPPNTPVFQYWYPAATVGLRVLVNRATRANGILEYAVGLDGSQGFYLNINENF